MGTVRSSSGSTASTRAMDAWASTSTSTRGARSSTASRTSRSCVAPSPRSRAGSAPSTSTVSTARVLPVRAASCSRSFRVGSSVVTFVATTPTRVPSRTAVAIMASSIFTTGIGTPPRTSSTQGDTVEQVTSTASASIAAASATCVCQPRRVLRRQAPAPPHPLQERLVEHVQQPHARQQLRPQPGEDLDQRRDGVDQDQKLRHGKETKGKKLRERSS